MRANINKILIGIAITLFWIGVWWGLSSLIKQEILLPSPLDVVKTLIDMWKTSAFWQAVGKSLLRVLFGFAAAVIVGTLLAMLTTRSRLADRLIAPLLHLVRSAPVASFIILAYVWVKVNALPSFIAFLMVVPLVWGNVREGILSTDRKLLEMAQIYRLGRWKTITNIQWPSLRPYFTAACTTGLGFAWKSGVAAEVICCPPKSIGKQLYSAKASLETPEVFAWTATVVILSVVLEKLLIHLLGTKKEVKV